MHVLLELLVRMPLLRFFLSVPMLASHGLLRKVPADH